MTWSQYPTLQLLCVVLHFMKQDSVSQTVSSCPPCPTCGACNTLAFAIYMVQAICAFIHQQQRAFMVTSKVHQSIKLQPVGPAYMLPAFGCLQIVCNVKFAAEQSASQLRLRPW